jgi:ATP-dependent Lon protease
MGKSKSKLLPIIPLPKGQILLPGISLRITIVNRPDIAALLAHIYSVSNNPRREGDAPITVGCIPLGSRYLSPDGKLLIQDPLERQDEAEADVHPAVAVKKDLFGYGCIAKVSGVQGRRQGELSLIVEGVQRFSVEKFVKERPYFEGPVLPHVDDGRSQCSLREQADTNELQTLFPPMQQSRVFSLT